MAEGDGAILRRRMPLPPPRLPVLGPTLFEPQRYNRRGTAAPGKPVPSRGKKRTATGVAQLALGSAVMPQTPTTVQELRERCKDWPEAVVRDAVVAALEEVRPTAADVLPPHVTLLVERRDLRQLWPLPVHGARVLAVAAFVARWLTGPEAKADDTPTLSLDLVAEIWRHLEKSGDPGRN